MRAWRALSGLHSDALQGNLSTIAREMVDTGESYLGESTSIQQRGDRSCCPVRRRCLWLAVLIRASGYTTLHVAGADPDGDACNVPAESVLSFRLRVDSKSQWKGQAGYRRHRHRRSCSASWKRQLTRRERESEPARVIAVAAS